MESEKNDSLGFEYAEAHRTQILFAFLEYLQEQKETLNEESAESVEVASQCLSSTFGIDITSAEEQKKYSLKPHKLPTIIGVGLAGKEKISSALEKLHKKSSSPEDIEQRFSQYVLMLKKKGYFDGIVPGSTEYEDRYSRARRKFFNGVIPTPGQPAASTPTAAASTPTAEPSTPVSAPSPAESTPSPKASEPKTPDPSRVEQAEKLKNEGNQKLQAKQYQEAIVSYTKAIELNPENAIYYANRAAAYSHIGEHENAVKDCKMSIEKNPSYSKAYGRLGLAHFSLGRYQEAVNAYSKALELEPNSASLKESLEAAKKKLTPEAATTPESARNQNQTRPTPPPGGMPDLSSLFGGRRPGAQGGGAPPNMADLLSNPALQNMAAQMMNNPAMMSMAQNLMSNPDALNSLMGAFGGMGGNQGNDDETQRGPQQ